MKRTTTSVPPTVRTSATVGLLVFALLPLLVRSIESKERTEASYADFAAQQRRNSSAIAAILGEFRTNLSDMLFIKTERYLHGGVAMTPHIDMQELATSGSVTTTKPSRSAEHVGESAHTSASDSAATSTAQRHEADHDHKDEHEVTTLIRTPDKDFRGFIGHLERQVKPWFDPRLPHQHIGGVELLPWYRLATLADPKNVRAYMIGAWWLKTLHDPKALREAEKFLEEGVRNNPRAFQLHLMRGYILRELGDKRAALKAFEEAYECMKAQRPPDGEVGPNWTRYNEEDAIAACTFSVLQVRELEEDDRKGLEQALERLAKVRNEIRNMPALERLERSLKAQLEAARRR